MPNKNTLDAVFQVLAICVIVDQKIRDKEMKEFCRQAAALSNLCGAPCPPEHALSWFKHAEPEILAKMASRGRNTVILKALTSIKDDVLRENVYDSMIAVSMSDSEFHRQESDLIRSAASIWGFARPPIKVSNP